MKLIFTCICVAIINAGCSSIPSQPLNRLPAQISSGDSTRCLKVSEGLDRMCARDPKADKDCVDSGVDSVAWLIDSCVVITGKEVVTSILTMPTASGIPDETFEKFSGEQIAQSILFRYFQNVERPKVTTEDALAANSSEYQDLSLMIAFPGSKISKIIANGFLNSHQTASSGGTIESQIDSYNSIRLELENVLAGVKIAGTTEAIDEKRARVLPKYAFASFSKKNGILEIRNADQNYGNVLAVLKSAVKKRAMVTDWDSYQAYITSPDLSHTKRTTAYRLKKDISFPTNKRYEEAQIWGPINFEDVEYLLIGCFPSYNNSDSSSRQILDDLHRSGIAVPAFKCNRTETSPTVEYSRGVLL